MAGPLRCLAIRELLQGQPSLTLALDKTLTFMSMRSREMLLPAGVTGLVAGTFLTAPEIITQAIGFIISSVVSLIVLLVFTRLAPVAQWQTGVRRVAIWTVAAFGAVLPYTGLFIKLLRG